MAITARRYENRRFRPYRTSGLYAQKPTPAQLSAGATLREQLIADRGGPDVVSTAESMLIDLIVAAKVKHADVHNYLVRLPRPWCNRKSHQAWRIVLDAAYLERHLAKLLLALGLERRPEAVETLADYVARKDAEQATGETASGAEEGVDDGGPAVPVHPGPVSAPVGRTERPGVPGGAHEPGDGDGAP
jgi:hypothetical protein